MAHAGLERRDQIDLALAHDGGVFFDEVALGFVEAVEDAAFGEERRLGRVHIFRGLRVGLERASAESDNLAVIIVDRKHHAVPKSAVELGAGPVVLRRGEAALLDFLARKFPVAQMIQQRIPRLRRVAELP